MVVVFHDDDDAAAAAAAAAADDDDDGDCGDGEDGDDDTYGNLNLYDPETAPGPGSLALRSRSASAAPRRWYRRRRLRVVEGLGWSFQIEAPGPEGIRVLTRTFKTCAGRDKVGTQALI